jgi:hypothetical protein
MIEWTVDTCVLYKVHEKTDVDALHFLLSVLDKHCVAFDKEGHIWKEYEKCLEKTRDRVLSEWFKRIVRDKRLVWHSGKLAARYKQALLKMKFDPSDLPFVGVASRSKDKLLVSEDSDYTREVCGYLQETLSVRVLSVDQGRTLINHDP